MKNLTGILMIIVLVMAGLACSGGDDISKINGLVDEANKFVTEANDAVKKVEAKGSEFDKKVDSVKSEADLKTVREMGKELLALYETMQSNFQKASDKFAEAGKVASNPKFKEYFELKAQEMKKRSELSGELKGIPKALDEAASEKVYKESAVKVVAKVQQLTKEANEIGEKADKIQRENPDIIKQS
jgi:hypothetical protein